MNPLARSMEELLPPSLSNSNWSFVLIRIALVMSSLFVAFIIPFFGTVMSLIGSLFSVLICVFYYFTRGFAPGCNTARFMLLENYGKECLDNAVLKAF
ncbi:Amino acid transporter avt1a [Orobanche minor]